MTDPADLSDRVAAVAVPLDAADSGVGVTAPPEVGGVEDLTPVVEAIGDARVIGLGEATHGTREFVRLKGRLLRYLIEERGLRAVALEANVAGARAVDAYVADGEGDPREALRDLRHWFPATEAFLAVVEWLRGFNEGRDAGDRVRVYGIDAGTVAAPAEALDAYLDRVDPDLRAAVADDLRAVARGLHGAGDDLDRRLDAAESLTDDLRARLDGRREAYVAAGGEDAYERARRDCRTIEQAATRLRTRSDGAGAHVTFTCRDEHMAENAARLLECGDADRLAVWAHNLHVAAGPIHERATRIPGGAWDDPGRAMGSFLRERYGDDYYALGLEFGRGGFRAAPGPELDADADRAAFSADAVREGSLPAVLDGVDEPRYFLDLDAAVEDERLADYLGAQRRLHCIGGRYYDDGEWNYGYAVPAAEFDGLVHVAETTPTAPLDGSD